MVNPSQRISAFTHADYDVSDAITFSLEGMFTRSRIGPSYTVPPYRLGTSASTWFSVSADNAYRPASIKAQMSGTGGGNAAGPAYLNVGRINDDWAGNMKIQNTNTIWRGVAGLKDKLGGGWSWDAYYQYGRNTYFGTVDNILIVVNANLAVDAVVAPAGNAAGVAAGTVVCRSTLTNPTNGCKPLNIFGVGAASFDAISYVLGQQWTRQTYQQHVAEASSQGSPFSTWVGPGSVAAGGSYRAESIGATSDALSMASAFVIGNPQPYSGSFNVKEAFGEVVVPLAKDAAWAKALDVNLAGRVTNYSLSGSVFTWKAGVTYKPGGGLMLRFTRSHDIRAPSLQELYTGAVQARVAVTDPTKATATTINASQFTGGNTALKPEKANMLAAGIVYQPPFLRGFSVSVDYYRIKIDDVTSTLSSQDIVNRCYAGNAALCNQITRVNGDITKIRSTNLNLNYLKTSGLDIEASYRSELHGSLRGSVGARVLANYVHDFVTSDGVTAVDIAGSIASVTSTGSGNSTPAQPHWTLQTWVFYALGRFQATVNNRYIGSGVIDNNYGVANAIDNNPVDSRLYTDLNLEDGFTARGKDVTLYLNVNNLFNVKPPKGFGWGYGLNASPTYDVIGPMFKAGIRFKL